MKAFYWFNLSLRDKYFGYKPEDVLVYVGMVDCTDIDDAYRKFNRIDGDVPVLDEAEAPSASVGDVIHMVPGTGDEFGDWFAVASFGFDKIERPEDECRIDNRKAGDVIQSVVNRMNRGAN